jgi:hypothetical protein
VGVVVGIGVVVTNVQQRSRLHPLDLQTVADLEVFRVHASRCLGCCALDVHLKVAQVIGFGVVVTGMQQFRAMH